MTDFLNLLGNRLHQISLTNPLNLVDLGLTIFMIITFLYYLRRLPVFRVVLGTFFLLFCSGIFFLSGLTLTALLFGIVSNLILLSLPLIFAPEIRHYLEKLGRFPFLRIPIFSNSQRKERFIRNLVNTAYELGERRVGGTIVLQRRTGLGETIDTGVVIDAKFGSKLISNLFFPKSPLHDGAIVIKDERIIAAGCLLPIHGEVKLDPPFGTRHKSGLSITKDTDAVVVLISEQRGEVSLAENGKFYVALERAELTEKLHKLL